MWVIPGGVGDFSYHSVYCSVTASAAAKCVWMMALDTKTNSDSKASRIDVSDRYLIKVQPRILAIWEFAMNCLKCVIHTWPWTLILPMKFWFSISNMKIVITQRPDQRKIIDICFLCTLRWKRYTNSKLSELLHRNNCTSIWCSWGPLLGNTMVFMASDVDYLFMNLLLDSYCSIFIFIQMPNSDTRTVKHLGRRNKSCLTDI